MRFNSFFNQSFRVGCAANKLDNNRYFRIVDNVVSGIGQDRRRLGHAAIARCVQVGYARQNQINAATLIHEFLFVE